MTDTYALEGKTAIVTGGGKGLGKTLAQFLLEAMQTIEQFDALFPGNVIGQVCDVSKSADVASFVRKVKDTFGELHVLINNSGFGKETLIWETSEKAWDEVMDTNVKGTFLMCKEVVPHMINNKEGYIINIASHKICNGGAWKSVARRSSPLRHSRSFPKPCTDTVAENKNRESGRWPDSK